MKKKTEPLAPVLKRLYGLLLVLTVLTVLNLVLTASIVGLIGAVVLLVMVWGIRRGDYPLTKGLSIFLFIYGAVNLIVLLGTLLTGAQARTSALIWLGIYSVGLIVIGALLRSKGLQQDLKTAPQPQEKEKRIHFFHGGWRDL